MKRVLLLGLLALASCAPQLSSATSEGSSGAAFTRVDGPTYQTLTFTSGPTDALKPVTVSLYGPAVRLNDTRCKVVLTWVECDLGTVGAGRTKTLYSTGVATGHIEFGRGDGKRYRAELK